MSGVILFESLKDAFWDTLFIVPVLFLTFLLIEVVEFFFFDKVSSYVKRSGAYAPLLGALAASFPQCGFSVIASVLYIRGFITKGALLAVYLSTSDEAVPVLLSMPGQAGLVLPVILLKILIGVSAGYAFDFFFGQKTFLQNGGMDVSARGCCEHALEGKDKKDLFLHPVVHTFTISAFIFAISVLINILISLFGSAEALGGLLMSGSPMQPLMAALFGLIPNCAISVALIMLYTKGSIAFCSLISGLCANSGLGIWVILTKNKNRKDSFFIVSSLFLISVFAGMFLYFVLKFIG